MLGKRTRPRPANITKLPDSSLMSGARFGFPETLTSPKCSLEYRILSPRSLKTSEQVAGIGLGIVAALEKSSSTATDVLPIPMPMSGSKPIPISGNKAKEEDVECMESFTYVTSHIPEKSYSKVYQSVTEVGGSGHDRSGCEDMAWRNSSVFYESPPRRLTQRNQAFPMLDFLSSCYLCRKNLHGADIYMYRGEKAFCSTECRCKQIATDERKEKCGSEVSRSFDISTSPYTRENIFFTGIIAA